MVIRKTAKLSWRSVRAEISLSPYSFKRAQKKIRLRSTKPDMFCISFYLASGGAGVGSVTGTGLFDSAGAEVLASPVLP